MPKLIVMKGLPASGKSTWAKAYVKSHPNTVRINRDDLRLMLYDVQFDPKVEDDITAFQEILMGQAFVLNRDIVVDNTNLNPKVMRHLGDWAKRNIYELEVKDFTHVSLSECIQRDSKRGAQSVGKKVITRMWRQFLQKPPEEPEFVMGAPYAIICDIDGTLAHINDHGKGAGRSHYDASRCGEDLLDLTVAEIVKSRAAQGDFVIYCSGREDTHRGVTEIWLESHGLTAFPHVLLMRPGGDNREDSIIKEEIFENSIRGKYNVRFCLDDRNRVVDKWRDLGLKCLQVGNGDF